jgi:hypothetical protein
MSGWLCQADLASVGPACSDFLGPRFFYRRIPHQEVLDFLGISRANLDFSMGCEVKSLDIFLSAFADVGSSETRFFMLSSPEILETFMGPA